MGKSHVNNIYKGGEIQMKKITKSSVKALIITAITAITTVVMTVIAFATTGSGRG
jgi:zinc transporter ZupT